MNIRAKFFGKCGVRQKSAVPSETVTKSEPYTFGIAAGHDLFRLWIMS